MKKNKKLVDTKLLIWIGIFMFLLAFATLIYAIVVAAKVFNEILNVSSLKEMLINTFVFSGIAYVLIPLFIFSNLWLLKWFFTKKKKNQFPIKLLFQKIQI
ncbi:hypothetical protein ACW95P_04230 [Candidatus Mycoplasma pogonae]